MGEYIYGIRSKQVKAKIEETGEVVVARLFEYLSKIKQEHSFHNL